MLSALDESPCIARAHRELEVSLATGNHFVVLVTFASSSELPGEFPLTVAWS